MSKIADAAANFANQAIPRSLLVGGAMALTAASQATILVDMMNGIKLKPDGTPYAYGNTSLFDLGAGQYGAQCFTGDGATLESGGMFLKKNSGINNIVDLQLVRFAVWNGEYTGFQASPDLETADKFITLDKNNGDFSLDTPINYGGVDVYRLNLNLSNFSSQLGTMQAGQKYTYAIAPVAGGGIDLTTSGIIVDGNYGNSSWYYNKNSTAPNTMENLFGSEFKYGATYLNSSAVPEPSSLAAVAIGVGALAGLRRRKKED